jgi:hypothetical protein
MTEQDLMHKIEWVNKRCSLKGEPLTQSQIELLMFVFADNVVNKNFASADVSGMSFCDKAERFVAWLNDENLASFWKEDKMLYYWTERDGEDIPAEMVLAMFEEEQKDLR